VLIKFCTYQAQAIAKSSCLWSSLKSVQRNQPDGNLLCTYTIVTTKPNDVLKPMEGYDVSPLVNNPRNDSPQCIQPIEG